MQFPEDGWLGCILRSVTGDRQGCAGGYGTTVKPGRVAAGDPVFIESGGR